MKAPAIDDDFEVVIRRLLPVELPPMTAEDVAMWMDEHGRITFVTQDEMYLRYPDPEER